MKKMLYNKVNELYDEAVNYWLDSNSSLKDEAIDDIIRDIEILCLRFLDVNSSFGLYVWRKLIQIELATGREVDGMTLFHFYRDSYIYKQRRYI